MSQNDELRDNIHGMIYDKAIEYANGHVVNFYEVADDIVELVRQETIKAQIAELVSLRNIEGSTVDAWASPDYQQILDSIEALESQLKELQ